MEKEERLKLYKKMLRDYRLSFFFPKRWYKTESGFCYNLTRYSVSLEDLSELISTKPDKNYNGGCMWFKSGKLRPRIKCLKKAIKMIKEQ